MSAAASSSSSSTISGTAIPQPSLGWDPFETLQIANPDQGDKRTCSGLTTKKKRCAKARSAAVYIDAERLLNRMARKDPASFLVGDAANEDLVELARLTLCRHHLPKQVEYAVEKWQKLITDAIRQQQRQRPRPRPYESDDEAIDLVSSPLSPRYRGGSGGSGGPAVAAIEWRRPSPVPWSDAASSARSRTVNSRRASSPASTATLDQGSDYASIQARLRGMTLKFQRLEAANAALQRNYVALRREDAEVRKENATLVRENTALWKEKAADEKKIRRTTRELTVVERERDSLEAQVEELYEEINYLREEDDSDDEQD